MNTIRWTAFLCIPLIFGCAESDGNKSTEDSSSTAADLDPEGLDTAEPVASVDTGTGPPAGGEGLACSCDYSELAGLCTEFVFDVDDQINRETCEAIEDSCLPSLGVEWAWEPCPLKNTVGACELGIEGFTSVIRYYDTGPLPYTPETAEDSCVSGFVFVP